MTYCLSYKNIWAIGSMTFTPSIGEEYILSPSIVNQQAGEHVWNADADLLLTAVGLNTCADTVSIRGLA
ncbi:branched-chain amino acid transport system II carrier protein [Xenorhabdus innexi]|uniref:Branched-chain amino acid transport system carrier protein n=1 Tax=Xenorhabdus innexi TaxID=290109 RepID=A0A1N6N1A5_9GAMM|nr:branched-chain amino acid transport system II carrier protein [Xenorhabdus innexi]PHM36970.1 branched-chain amino acid transport system II carrier protein [Xenorhabdus innexi]SIP74881.1 Branched-chain amino acid transport system II (LIV-II) (LIVCS family) [Xenorhabdus innexi]